MSIIRELISDYEIDFVLPGHRSVFTDCDGRIAALKRHHHNRLEEVRSILEGGPRTAYETASHMTWDIVARSWQDFPVVQKWFAVSEAVSHLRYLVHREAATGAAVDGVIRYALDGTG